MGLLIIYCLQDKNLPGAYITEMYFYSKMQYILKILR